MESETLKILMAVVGVLVFFGITMLVLVGLVFYLLSRRGQPIWKALGLVLLPLLYAVPASTTLVYRGADRVIEAQLLPVPVVTAYIAYGVALAAMVFFSWQGWQEGFRKKSERDPKTGPATESGTRPS